MKYILIILCATSGLLTAQQSPFTWKEFVVGSPAMSIVVPGILIPQEAAIPENIAAYMKKYEAYYLNDDSHGMVITMMHLVYSGEIIADLVGAANGTLNQWEATGAKLDVQTFTKLLTDGKNSILQKGSFSIDGKQSIFTNLVIGDGASMWQIAMIVPAKDETMATTMSRMYDSIRFK
jgi:hypothetical protein